jgi:hypothetical protein
MVAALGVDFGDPSCGSKRSAGLFELTFRLQLHLQTSLSLLAPAALPRSE